MAKENVYTKVSNSSRFQEEVKEKAGMVGAHPTLSRVSKEKKVGTRARCYGHALHLPPESATQA